MNANPVVDGGNVPEMDAPEPTALPGLDFEVEVTDGAVVLHVGGEVDVVTAPDFEKKLAGLVSTCERAVLVADLSRVRFLSSAGLAVLMRTDDALEGRSRFLVVATGAATYRPMEVTGLTDELEVFDSVDAALSTV